LKYRLFCSSSGLKVGTVSWSRPALDALHPLVDLAQIVTAGTVKSCIAAFRALLAPLGIDTFASGETDVNHRERSVFHVIDWPDDWRKFYFSSGLLERDPVVQGLELFDGPFTWQELRRKRFFASVGTETLDRVAAAGWRDGLVVPIRRAATRYALISLVSRQTIISADHKQLLSVASICFHSRILERITYADFPMPPAGLTQREVECIASMARGLSEAETAADFGIGHATVHEHLERARRKLLVTNRAELVALAISMGMLRL
jgi:LuxR family transcriptional regulator, quorum-sensing system regulator BjaR1